MASAYETATAGVCTGGKDVSECGENPGGARPCQEGRSQFPGTSL